MTEKQKTDTFPLAGYILGVALSLTISLPLIAVGAAVALRLFCIIAGVCA